MSADLRQGGPAREVSPLTRLRRGRWGVGRRWIAAVVLAVVMVGIAVVALLQQGRPAMADVTENVIRQTPLPPLTVAGRQTQQLVARENGLSGVYANLGTYGGNTDCALTFSLTDDQGRSVGESRRDCGDFDDSLVGELIHVPPQPDSRGRTYTFSASLAPGDWTESVSLWGGPVPDGCCPVELDGKPASLTAAVFTTYGAPQTFLERVPTVLERMSMSGPWWGSAPLVLLWTLALGGLVVGIALVPRRALVLLLALALARGLLWSALIPPMEGPDEAAHVAYGQFIAEEGAVPRRGTDLDGLIGYSPQLVALIAGVHQLAGSPTDRLGYEQSELDRLQAALRSASPRAGGSQPAAGYPPAYYAPLAVAYQVTPGTLRDRIYSMRLVSVVLGIIAAGFTFAFVRRLLPGHPTAAGLLTAAVLLQPMVSQQFAVVNNDALVMTAGAAGLAVAMRILQEGASVRLMLLAGALVGAALLGKPYGVAVVGPIAVAWLVSTAVRRRRQFARWARELGAAAAGLLGTYGVWLAVSWIGDYPSTAQGLVLTKGEDRGVLDFLALQVHVSLRPQASLQMWGNFSWLDTQLPSPLVDAVWFTLVAVMLASAGWLALQAVDLVRLRRSRGPLVGAEGLHVAGATAVALGTVLTTWAVLWAAGYVHFLATGGNDLLQGRYALLCVPALIALPVLLVRRFTRVVPPAVVVGGLLLALWTLQVSSLQVVATRFYG